MPKLKLGPLEDQKPVKVAVELPAGTHRNLCAYADALGRQTGQQVNDPALLIAPMLERFMAADRGFTSSTRKG